MAELFVHDRFDGRFHLGIAEFPFGLPFELRVFQPYGNDSREPFADVVGRQVLVLLFEQTELARVGVDRARERGFETGEVMPAFDGMDVICEAHDVLLERLRVLHGHFHETVGGVFLEPNGHADLFLRFVEMRHVCGNAPLEVEAVEPRILLVLLRALGSGIHHGNCDAAGQIRLLAQTVDNDIHAETEAVEDFVIGPEANKRAALFGLADFLHVRHRLAAPVLLHINVAVAVDLHPHLLRERIHDGGTHTVESAAHFVAALVPAEFSAGVQRRENHFERRLFGCGMHIHRNAAAVIFHAHRTVILQRARNDVCVAGHRLVDTVIHDLVHEMVESPDIGGTDVHAGALADGFQPLQDLNLLCGIIIFCHIGKMV